jgi:hypothetical protein
MTAFYWLDTEAEALDDAILKGFATDKWIFCIDKAGLKVIDITNYDGIYLKAGLIELEKEFAKIMRRSQPRWLC